MTEVDAAAAQGARRARSRWRDGLRGFLRHRLALLGTLLLAMEVALAVLAPVVSPYEPNSMDFRAVLKGASFEHPFGTDELGRDIFTRVLHGARLSMTVGVMAVLLAAAVGVPLGLVSGYFGGYIDEGMMRIVDSVMALPALVLALTISAVLGSGLVNATIAIAIVSAPTYTRLVRGQVLSIKHNDYVVAAHAIGAPAWVVLLRHILPNTFSPIIVQASLGVGFAIILESSLSFIGLGAQPPTASWGNMVQVGFQYLETAPWYAFAPASAIFLAVLGFNMLGDGLRDVLDPRFQE